MRIILLALLTSLSSLANAQLWELADQRTEGIHLSEALPLGGDRWAVIGRTGTQGDHLISVYNSDGSLAWEEVSSFAGDEEMGQVILMPDSGLLYVGGYDGCAYFGPESRVRRYASDGTVLWESVIYPIDGSPITMAAKSPISHLAMASSDSVYFMNMDGIATGGFQVPISEYVNGMVWATDSTLFMGRGTDLMLVNMDGTQLATATVGYIEDMHWDGQQLYVLLTDNSVRRFNPALEPLSSSLLPGADFQTTSRFITSGNALYVNTANGLYELDSSGIPNLVFSWPVLPNLVTMGCAVRDSLVLAVGNTDISGRSTGIVRTLSMVGDAPQHDQDVEVLVEVDSTWNEYTGFPDYPWDWKADLTGFVVNHGSDTLRSVVLSMWVSMPIDFMFCGQPANRIDTIGMALAPTDTAWLPFGVVDVSLGNTVQWGGFTICIVALAPDHLADRAPADNTACGTFDSTLGVKDHLHGTSLSLAPNPAVHSCVVSGLAALGAPVQVRIMDLTGRMVAAHNSTASASNMELDISSLAPATYLVQAVGRNGQSMAKLVVARP